MQKGVYIMFKKLIAEFFATFILVLVGCGVAIGVGCADSGGIVATAAAFGLSIVILAYSFGQISGGHANPAVSFAKALNKELTWKEFGIYCCAQVLGAFVGSLLLALVMWAWKSGVAGQTHLYNGYIAQVSLDGSKGLAVMLSTMAEMGLTFLFVFAVLMERKSLLFPNVLSDNLLPE